MALNVFELFGTIAVDSSGAKKGIDSAVGHAKKAENKFSESFKKIGKAVAAAFTVKAVVDFGKQCTQAYANIAAEEAAFSQVMGDYADKANEKLDAVSAKTGVSSTRMTSAMTSLTAKFKGLGYSVDDATTLASDGLILASDAAAMWDMSLEESMSHLNSFINGSYEGGEAIALFANDTQMAQYAISQGIVNTAKEWANLDEATRQATRLMFAREKYTQMGADGQSLIESKDFKNTLAEMKESWRQFQGVVGKPILEKFVLPAMQKLNAFMPKLTESVQNGIVWLEEGFGKVKEYFAEVFTEDGIKLDALPDALTKMFRDMGRRAVTLAKRFGNTLSSGLFDAGVKAARNILTTASTLVADVVGSITGKKEDADKIGGVFKDLFGVASEVVIGIKDSAIDAFQWFADNGELSSVGIGAVAASLALLAKASFKFALSNPMILALDAIIAFVAFLAVDWKNFESNYPQLVEMFESLTGLEFTNVANSIDTLKKSLIGLIEWFANNKYATEGLVMILGGLAIAMGHPVAGIGLIGSVLPEVWKDYIDNIANPVLEDPVGAANRANENLQDGNTILHYMTGTGAYSKDEDGNTQLNNYSRDTNPWERLMLWWAGVLGEETKQKLEESWGLVEKNEPEPEIYGPPAPEWFKYDDVVPKGTDGSNNVPAFFASLQTIVTQMRTDVVAAVQEGIIDGLGGITITGNVTTGNVVLDSGTLVGSITPKIDMRLGDVSRRGVRG